MNERELREIKRRFRAERSAIPRLVGCLVNASSRAIVSRISQPLGLTESLVSEKLLGVMKKTLSGSLGTNLTGVSYTPKQVLDGAPHQLLMALTKERLANEETLERFYASVIGSLSLETNYAILLAADTYDVPSKRRDGSEGDSEEVFTYIVCAVCPVKNMPEAITFRESDCLFHALGGSALLASPELGFMFPAFDDRRANIYGALYYTHSLGESYPDFAKNVLDHEAHMPPKLQKATFSQCLSSALGDECSYEVVRSVHAQVGEMIASHKETKDPEPLLITKSTVKEMLASAGVAEEKLELVGQAIDEGFGPNAEIAPKNIVSPSKFELSLPEISVKVDPEHRDLVSTQTIGGMKYVMIRVTGSVEVNGVPITIDE